MNRFKHIIKRAFYFLTNNVIFNNLLIFAGKDRYFSTRGNPYTRYIAAGSKSVQENAGYSNRKEINEVLEKSKQDLLKAVDENLNPQNRILDIGCGPGMYLSLFKNKSYELHATDINASMLDEASRQVPEAQFYHGDFMKVDIPKKFNFIYCIGVLIYISRSDIEGFFKKIYDSLEPGGILYLNYPHAISLWDTLYKDITYIQYSPAVIEKLINPYFDILTHHHAFDRRIIRRYDKKPYKSLNPHTHRTYKNSYLLVAKKKKP